MSQSFVAVQWSKKKIVYDLILVAAVFIYLTLFKMVAGGAFSEARAVTYDIVLMRAWGSCAFLMLTMILLIGPLARLNRRFVPLLYNRRHFGVLFFLVALQHARQVLGYYHNYGFLTQLESLLTFDASFTGSSMPFQLFGAAALLIFLVMAVTSHDFWQKLLGPAFWKSMHMMVYAGYVLVVLHVAFGAMQFEDHPVFAAVVGLSVLSVSGLHLFAAQRSTGCDRSTLRTVTIDGKRWIDAGPAEHIPNTRALPVKTPDGETVALVRSSDRISAIHGVCAHQGGPLAEGKVIDDCLTCPWHGWQYLPAEGRSPPPFTEELPTYSIRLADNGHVLVDPSPHPPGTACPPIILGSGQGQGDDA